MSDLSNVRELYQQMIIDHGRHPRNFCVCDNADRKKEGYNPLCGDEITIYLFLEDNVIKKACFNGKGCAISIASASLMCEALTGKTLSEVKKLFKSFHELVANDNSSQSQNLGKLSVLAGVKEFPVRVKCATLAWHTMLAALENGKGAVSTE